MRPYTSSSSTSSKLLNDYISTVDQYTARTRSEAIRSHLTGLYSQPLDHLLTDRSTIDEYELVRLTLNSDIFNKEDT